MRDRAIRRPLVRTVIVILLAVLLTVGALGGFLFWRHVHAQGTEEPPLDEKLTERLAAYETVLRDALRSLDTDDDVTDYLLTWAENQEIEAVRDAAGNVLYRLPATKAWLDSHPAAVGSEETDAGKGRGAADAGPDDAGSAAGKSASDKTDVDGTGGAAAGGAIAARMSVGGTGAGGKETNETAADEADAETGAALPGPVALLCGFEAADMESYVPDLTLALSVAQCVQEHGDVSLLFLRETHGCPPDDLTLPKEWLADVTEMIDIGHASASALSLTSGGLLQVSITDDGKAVEPSYDTAYRITLSGLPAPAVDRTIGEVLNPVQTLGSLLAELQSSSLPFELASFAGGEADMHVAAEASMTLVINEGDVNKFLRKVSDTIEDVSERWRGDIPTLAFTCEPCAMPESVLRARQKDNFISLMYTALQGVVRRDTSGHVTMLANLDSVQADPLSIEIHASLMASSGTQLAELDKTYQTICGLCNMTYETVRTVEPFDGGLPAVTARGSEEMNAIPGAAVAASPLYIQLTRAFRTFTGQSGPTVAGRVEPSACTRLSALYPQATLGHLDVRTEDAVDYAGMLVHWLAL